MTDILTAEDLAELHEDVATAVYGDAYLPETVARLLATIDAKDAELAESEKRGEWAWQLAQSMVPPEALAAADAELATLRTRVAELEAALREWKCRACGGRKTEICMCDGQSCRSGCRGGEPCRRCEGTGIAEQARRVLSSASCPFGGTGGAGMRDVEGLLVELGEHLLTEDGCRNGPYGPICLRLTGKLCVKCLFLWEFGFKELPEDVQAEVER